MFYNKLKHLKFLFKCTVLRNSPPMQRCPCLGEEQCVHFVFSVSQENDVISQNGQFIADGSPDWRKQFRCFKASLHSKQTVEALLKRKGVYCCSKSTHSKMKDLFSQKRWNVNHLKVFIPYLSICTFHIFNYCALISFVLLKNGCIHLDGWIFTLFYFCKLKLVK